ncbi:hypothetical protein EV356DRAFT_528472 [Viridothelium virens]|uniref:Ubiquitin-like-conjugating enzyme ATG10 n=1 Tax=Viridothelium virens TaxID=1048519 RepID=A0A6A6HMG0_VIRVR|nr:hypothetical protein EV356DRAFT_528472 [Viridothelium virens]
MSTVADFPLASNDELDLAFNHLQEAFYRLQDVSTGWTAVEVKSHLGQRYLRVSRQLVAPDSIADQEDNSVVHEFEEDDPEALQNPVATSRVPRVDYDVILSPIYRVPVVYFRLRDATVRNENPIDTVFRYIVPHDHHHEVKVVGIVGGITMTDHPIEGTPAFFVHPCNTAEALHHAAEQTTALTPLQYLQLWMGIVGPVVGLYIPTVLALKLEGLEQDS